MYITIDERDRRPLYQQVADEIKALIARGELKEGNSLPPVRQVAADLGVNLNTIAHAYRRLQAEGLIRVRHGAGAVVTSRIMIEKSEERLQAQLRAALTQLILAGMSRNGVLALVTEQLNSLTKDPVRSEHGQRS
ncbi:MAG TPA: GntR family transcriptional regulator [Pyrinomonadaceae bacterium]|nr:GntR family transcriptional regulator [Pyrinomonadaceae bacterium]